MKPPVADKKDFYRRRARLEFGNSLRTWDTWRDLIRSDYEGPIGIRNIVPGGPFVGPIPYGLWYVERKKLLQSGVKKEDMRFGEAAPDDRCVFQGETCETSRGLELRYSTRAGMTHREAMGAAQNVQGLTAWSILHHFLEPVDVDELKELLNLYPDHVVEFSTYAFPVGNIPGHCTLIWEVRQY